MKRLLSLSILIIGLLTACGPDKDIFIPDPIFSQGIITSSISGYVIDENNQSVEGASVNLNQFSRTTDANGYFNFQNVQVDAERTSLTVSMQGYFEGGRAILPIEDGITQLKIKLLEKTVINSFEGSNGGTVDLQQGTVLEIPADAALDQNNVGFSGEVQVASHNLNPQNLDGLSKMPTDLKANDASNQELLLESFGIFLFEWTDASDQKLSIVPGKKATLTFPVPPSMIANAPANIGLWFFKLCRRIEQNWFLEFCSAT